MKIPQQIALYSNPNDTQITRYNYYISAVYPELTTSQINYIRALNPNAKIYYYRNFMSGNGNPITAPDGYSGSDITYFRNKGWLLHITSGAELVSGAEYAVDSANAGYMAWLAWFCQQKMMLGYDGIFSDNFPRICYPVYAFGSNPRAVNPRTGALYTDTEYYTDSLNLCLFVRDSTTPQMPIINNGIPQGNGSEGYYGSTTNRQRCDYIISQFTGQLDEGSIAWTLADFNSRSVTIWKQNVDYLSVLVNSGKVAMFSNGGSADMETDDVARFTFCTYMMAQPFDQILAKKYSIKFRGAIYMDSNPYWNSLMDINLGMPLDSMSLVGSDYVRHFTGGEIRVNPTSKTSVITLNGGENVGTKNGVGKVVVEGTNVPVSGANVVVTITKPDTTKVTLNAVTLTDGSYGVTFTDLPSTIPYNYSAVAQASLQYNPSLPVTGQFTIEKLNQVITLVWS